MTAFTEVFRPRFNNPLTGVIERAQEAIGSSAFCQRMTHVAQEAVNKAYEKGRQAQAVGKYLVEHREEVARQLKSSVIEAIPSTATGIAVRAAVGTGATIAGVGAVPVLVGAGLAANVASSIVSVDVGVKKRGLEGFYDQQMILPSRKHAAATTDESRVPSNQENTLSTKPFGIRQGLRAAWEVAKAVTYGNKPRQWAIDKAFKTEPRKARAAELAQSINGRSPDEVLSQYREKVRGEIGVSEYGVEVDRRVAKEIVHDLTDIQMARVVRVDSNVPRDEQSTREAFNTLASALKEISTGESVLKNIRSARHDAKRRAKIAKAAVSILQMPGKMAVGGFVADKIGHVLGFIHDADRSYDAVEHVRSQAHFDPTDSRQVAQAVAIRSAKKAIQQAAAVAGASQSPLSDHRAEYIMVAPQSVKANLVEAAQSVASVPRPLESFQTLTIKPGGSITQAMVDAGIYQKDYYSAAGSAKPVLESISDSFVAIGKMSPETAAHLKDLASRTNMSWGEFYHLHQAEIEGKISVQPGMRLTVKTDFPISNSTDLHKLAKFDQIEGTANVGLYHNTSLTQRINGLAAPAMPHAEGTAAGSAGPRFDPNPGAPPLDNPPPTGHYEAQTINGLKKIVWVQDTPQPVIREIVPTTSDNSVVDSQTLPVNQPVTVPTGQYEYKSVLENGIWVIKYVPVSQPTEAPVDTNTIHINNAAIGDPDHEIERVRAHLQNIQINQPASHPDIIQPDIVQHPAVVEPPVQVEAKPASVVSFNYENQDQNAGISFSSNVPELKKPWYVPYDWKPIPFSKFEVYNGQNTDLLLNPPQNEIAVYGGLNLTGAPGERVGIFTCADLGQKRTLLELVSDSTTNPAIQHSSNIPTVLIGHADGWFYPNKEHPTEWRYGLFEPFSKLVADYYKARGISFGQWIDLDGTVRITITNKDGQVLVYKGLRAIIMNDLTNLDMQEIVKMLQ